MGVVLSETADAKQSVHDAGALIAIDGAEFAEAYGEITIGAQRVFVNKDVTGAVHRLEAILSVVELHGIEHVLRVIALVP